MIALQNLYFIFNLFYLTFSIFSTVEKKIIAILNQHSAEFPKKYGKRAEITRKKTFKKTLNLLSFALRLKGTASK